MQYFNWTAVSRLVICQMGECLRPGWISQRLHLDTDHLECRRQVVFCLMRALVAGMHFMIANT